MAHRIRRLTPRCRLAGPFGGTSVLTEGGPEAPAPPGPNRLPGPSPVRLPPKRVGPPASGVADFPDVTGGVYKARERIHRSVADLRLLATPTSWGRVADPNPN